MQLVTIGNFLVGQVLEVACEHGRLVGASSGVNIVAARQLLTMCLDHPVVTSMSEEGEKSSSECFSPDVHPVPRENLHLDIP